VIFRLPTFLPPHEERTFMRYLSLAVAALALIAGAAPAASLSGKYVEARTCDVWTGPCYANAEMSLSGKNAIIGWVIDKGSFDGVKLDGLGVVAVIAARDTLGMRQSGKAKAVLIVDKKATKAQQEALVKLVRKQSADLIGEVLAVVSDKVELDICECDEGGCAKLSAGKAKIETRCLNAKHDKVCGNESACYEPLTKNVKAKPALATEHSYQGKGIGSTWKDSNRRGAYLGTFEMR
jgi:hypothetical protein